MSIKVSQNPTYSNNCDICDDISAEFPNMKEATQWGFEHMSKHHSDSDQKTVPAVSEVDRLKAELSETHTDLDLTRKCVNVLRDELSVTVKERNEARIMVNTVFDILRFPQAEEDPSLNKFNDALKKWKESQEFTNSMRDKLRKSSA